MLTDEKRQEIESLLEKVNVTGICRELYRKRKIPNSRTATVYEVLRGKSENFDFLAAVVKEARLIVKQRSKKVQSL